MASWAASWPASRIAAGAPAPTVWERIASRRAGAVGYAVTSTPTPTTAATIAASTTCSGDAALVDALVQRLAPGGEIVLAGFYKAPIAFAFPPAFMREARFRIAAEWKPADMAAVLDASRRRATDARRPHHASRAAPPRADAACRTAFDDPDCLKMILDWSDMR